MKIFLSLLTFAALSMSTFAQNATYIHYELKMDASGEEAEMMAMMMEGSTMEIASDGVSSYVKTVFGNMYTMEIETHEDGKEATALITGMMGDMAYSGTPEKNDDVDTNNGQDFDFVKGKKKILGYKCNKAITVDEDGNESVFWYTKKIANPGIDQMPNAIPGLCLEMNIRAEGVNMVYTATQVLDSANMSDYKVVIPEGIEVQPWGELGNMGQ